MLATSKNVLIPGHNHLLTAGADDLTRDYRLSASKVNNRSEWSLAPVVNRWL